MVANPKHGDAAVADEEDLLQHRRTMKPHEVNSEVIILWCLLRLVVMVMVVFVLKSAVAERVPRGGFEHLRLRQY